MSENDDKKSLLEKLKKELSDDDKMPLKNSNLVFGEGRADAKVCFIGEAPGFYEDREGRPFVGRAGKLLDKLINGVGWKREEVYITNIIKRRPPENRDPTPDEIAAFSPYLSKQVEIINPKIIVPLGRFAMNYFLPTAKISKDQGKLFWWGQRLIIPIYHPAAALRSTKVMEELEKSFRRIPAAVEKYDSFLKERDNAKDTKEEPEQKSLF
mgnify:CR=1 FL=1